MEPILFSYYKSPIGEMKLASFREYLLMADWRYRRMRQAIDKRVCSMINTEMKEGQSEVIQAAAQQLKEYFENKRTQFDLPLQFVGTTFQASVWQKLQHIPFGQTMTYMELANSMQHSDAIRAIASANGANAISVIVPCHRIIGSNHELVGYAGGLDAKRKLLMLEGSWKQMELF